MARWDNIYDAVADVSARRGIPREAILARALREIAAGRLAADLPEDAALDTRLHGNVTWRDLLYQGALAVEHRPSFFAGWFRSIGVHPSDVDRWVRQTMEMHNRPTRGPKPTKRQSVIKLMTADLGRNRLSLAELESMKEKTMEHRYRASRFTCRNARNMVLSDHLMAKSAK